MSQHLSRLAAPKSWPMQRKGIKWIAKPSAGKHALKKSVTIKLILTNILKYANTNKETKRILNSKKIIVDKRIVTDPKFAVGVMDVLEIPSTNEYYRVLFDSKGKFFLTNIKKEEAMLKPKKITGKTILKKKKTQLNFYDSTNMLVEKDGYRVGDTVIVDMTKNTIKKHLKLEKGAKIYLTDGNHAGSTGSVEEIKKKMRKSSIIFKSEKEKHETAMAYAFVIENTKTGERNG